MELTLERKDQPNLTPVLGGGRMQITPPIEESYWQYRVKLSDTQAIVGFPKFSTIGIGFAQEEDWNTNLPYTSDAEDIFKHIAHNKGDKSIKNADCIAAIRMIQAAVREDRA